MTPRFHPAALRELASAMNIGEERASGLGRELLLEVRRVVEVLCDTPRIGQPLDEHRRRFPLKRFPFAIIYRINGNTLRVLAIAHRRQRPGLWRGTSVTSNKAMERTVMDKAPTGRAARAASSTLTRQRAAAEQHR
jgi:plasmid stabilization system protein ParE